MTERLSLQLWNAQQGHQALQQAWHWLKPMLLAGHRLTLEAKKATRSSEQNRRMWAILEAFSFQLQWPVNGELVYMSKEEWKDVLSAAFRREKLRMAMGLDGGVVMLGQRTSTFSKSEFNEWMEFLSATAAHRGVEFQEELAA